VAFKLLAEFEALFSGVVYLHRISTRGDRVAGYLYEDLFDLARSPKYVARVIDQTRVLNTTNRATGLAARRGDGTFGERDAARTNAEYSSALIRISREYERRF
jgi:hypothetical protein